MSDSIPPLDDELRDLLSAERGRPPVPPATRAKLLSRVEASLAVGAVGVGVGASALAVKSGSKAWIVAVAFFVGGVVGAGVTWVAKGSTERVVEKRIEVPSVVTVTVTVPASVPAVPPPIASVSAPPTENKPRTTPLAAPSDASEERNLIDAMRTALKSGDPAGALGFVAAHEKRFPSGAFVEEREAYAVQALARSGRTVDARTRGERFRKRYPSSLLLPVVDQAIGAP